MRAQTPINLTLSVLCFSVVLAIYQQAVSLLSIPGRPGATQLVSFLIAAGLFTFIFQIALWLSNALGRRWLSANSRLVGRWYQVFRIHNYTKSSLSADSIRHGPVTIAYSGDLLEITAENRGAHHDAPSSTWYSDKVSIQGSQVWLLYSSTGAGRGSTHGNMLFQFQPASAPWRRPERLLGQFADSSPSTHFGSIELFRDQGAYAARVQELVHSPQKPKP